MHLNKAVTSKEEELGVWEKSQAQTTTHAEQPGSVGSPGGQAARARRGWLEPRGVGWTEGPRSRGRDFGLFLKNSQEY